MYYMYGCVQWLVPVIPTIQKAEIRSIMGLGQPWQNLNKQAECGVAPL
jgi:hypothetical protein